MSGRGISQAEVRYTVTHLCASGVWQEKSKTWVFSGGHFPNADMKHPGVVLTENGWFVSAWWPDFIDCGPQSCEK